MSKFLFALFLVAALQSTAFGTRRVTATSSRSGHRPSARRPDADDNTQRFRERKTRRVAAEEVARPDAARSSRGKIKPPSRVKSTPVVTYQTGNSLPITNVESRRKQRHWDPTRSGNPQVVTIGEYRFIKLSKNFTAEEFARSGKVAFGISRIDPKLVACLQNIRDAVDQPVWITSGYRSYFHNIAVYNSLGRKPTDSQHIAGKAADIKIDGMTGLDIGKTAVKACGPDIGVGIGVGFAHVDVRGVFASWRYKGTTGQELAELRQRRDAYLLALRSRVRQKRKHSARGRSRVDTSGM
jgi:hypothetical protein